MKRLGELSLGNLVLRESQTEIFKDSLRSSGDFARLGSGGVTSNL